MRQAKFGRLELKRAFFMTRQLDLSMTRALISQSDLGMTLTLIVGSMLVRRTSGLAIRANLVTCVSRHVRQGRSVSEDESEEGRQRIKGGNGGEQ